jgi:hypothetical protein
VLLGAVGALLALSPLGSAQGKGHGVEVVAVSPQVASTRPGEIVNMSFRVTNRGETEGEFAESVELPDGWLSVISPSSFRLQPDEALARIVSVVVPRGAGAQAYTVVYRVASRRDPAIQDSDAVAVGVVAVSGLEVVLTDCPANVLAGDAYTAAFQVVNRGNAPSEVQLQATGTHGFGVKLEPETLSLQAGETGEVRVTVSTRPDLAAAAHHSLQLSATPAAAERKAVTAATIVDVIPRVSARFDPRHRIPARLTVAAMGGGGRSGMQIELEGSGSTTETGRDELEFLLRGPDAQAAGFFGRRDEMRVNYATDRFELLLGDQSYELSQLTDNGRYGRGGGVAWHAGSRLEIGAHYAADRWGTTGLEQFAGHAGASLGSSARVRLNYLRQLEADPLQGGRLDDSILSLEAESRLGEAVRLSAEYAYNERKGPRPTADDAYRVALDGQWRGRAYYSFSTVHAGLDYHGAYQDCDYTHAALSVPLSDRWQADASWNRLRAGAAEAIGGAGTFEELARGGLRYAFSRDLSATVGYEELLHRAIGPAGDGSTRERAARLGLQGSSDRWSFGANLNLGTQSGSAPEACPRTVAYGSLRAAYRLAEDRVLTVYGATGGQGSPAARLLVPAHNLGFSALWSFGERLRLRTGFTAYGGSGLGDQFELQADYGLPQETVWSLRARVAHEEAVLLSWSRPLELPGARRTTVGAVRGRILDVQSPDRVGIANAVLSLGNLTAATDRNGRFTFANLPPGEYRLQVDAASIGLNRVAEAPLPPVVTVLPGRAADVEIGVVEGARVEGRVVVVTPQTGDQDEGYVTGGFTEGTQAPAGVGGVLLELASGEEVYRRLTDKDGRFAFDRLHPGQWYLEVRSGNLPAFHVVENPQTAFSLTPGQSVETEVRIVPQKRRIRMLDEGRPEVIRLGGGPSAPRNASAAKQPEPPAPSPAMPTPGDLREGLVDTRNPRRVVTPQDAFRTQPPTVTDRG